MRIKSFKDFNKKFLLVNFRSPKTPILKKVLDAIGFNLTMVTWDEVAKTHLIEIDGIILSGSPTNLTSTDNDPYMERYSFLKDIEIPILGICFGHQVLGAVFGGKINHGEEISGDVKIDIVEKDPLLVGFPKVITMKEHHTESVSLPNGFILLGKSDSCDNEIMKHAEKDIYGVQFHPEQSGSNGDILLKNFYDICDNNAEFRSHNLERTTILGKDVLGEPTGTTIF